MVRNSYGQFRRAAEDKTLSPSMQARRERQVSQIMERAKSLHGPGHDVEAVVAQKLFLIKSGLMPAREAFAPKRFTPSR